MVINRGQQDALIELVNIGLARAADALSRMTGKHVTLNVPMLEIRPMGELPDALIQSLDGELASVHQIFDGTVAGDALLLLKSADALKLTALLTGEPAQSLSQASTREAMSELGNILLNALLGTFGNLLRVQVHFMLPRLHLDALSGVLSSLAVAQRELKQAVIVHTGFSLREDAIQGFLVLVMESSALDRLIVEVGNWEKRCSGGES